jgi:hypothetical protein
MSFATPASAWRIYSSWGLSGAVFWNIDQSPYIKSGLDYTNFNLNNIQVANDPTVYASNPGPYWQRVAVRIRTYYYCAGNYWCTGPQVTQFSGWMHPGQWVTFRADPRPGYQGLYVTIPHDGRYVTAMADVYWYNSSNQAFAGLTEYPDRGGPLRFGEFWGSLDMACHMYAVNGGYCAPGGLKVAQNLNTPTGSIYSLRACPGNPYGCGQ